MYLKCVDLKIWSFQTNTGRWLTGLEITNLYCVINYNPDSNASACHLRIPPLAHRLFVRWTTLTHRWQFMTVAHQWPIIGPPEIPPVVQCWPTNVITRVAQSWATSGPLSEIARGGPTLAQWTKSWWRCWVNVGPPVQCYLGKCLFILNKHWNSQHTHRKSNVTC